MASPFKIFRSVGNIFTSGSAQRLFGTAGGAIKRAAGAAKRAMSSQARKALERLPDSPIKPLPAPGERTRVFGTSAAPAPKQSDIYDPRYKDRMTVDDLFGNIEVPPPEPFRGKRPYYSSDLERFLDGQMIEVESEHVKWIQYEGAQTEVLYICFHSGVGNNAVYQYLDIDEAYAEKVFNSGDHVGTMVWDYLRRRGTVFGYQKPYSLAAGGHGSYRVNLGDYQPKYTQRPEWEQQHSEIPSSGAVPKEWADGRGPYTWDEPYMSNQPVQGGGTTDNPNSGKGPKPWWY